MILELVKDRILMVGYSRSCHYCASRGKNVLYNDVRRDLGVGWIEKKELA